jgi:glycosyltransferase involved in cell wall biosynthesis
MSKRILILTQYYPPEMGAPQSRLYETAKGLKQRGWEVMVLTSLPNYPTGSIFKEYQNKFYVREYMDEMPVIRTWIYASNSKKPLPRIISMLSFSITCLMSLFHIRRFKPTIIFTESPPLTLAASGVVLSWFTRAKHIMNVSDIWPLSAYELGAIRKGFVYSTLEWIEKKCYQFSKAATGQSEQIVHHLIQNKVKRTHLYRNGVDVIRFELLQYTTDSSKKLKIIYAGLLGVAQGIFDLCSKIDYAAIPAELHIYGDGAEKIAICDYIEKNPHCSVFYHGKANREQIPQILNSYDCTIIPLIKPIYGAVPSKIYEAMAAGLPIIFAGGGEGAEIIHKYHCGWVCPPYNFKLIEDTIKIMTLLPDTDRKQISSNCKEAAYNHFNREKQIDSLNHFLNSI